MADTGVSRKELYSMALLCVIIFCLSLILYGYYKEEKIKNMGCYYFHVSECEDCHVQNKTYLLCSGFCMDPQPDDNTYGCYRIGLKANCSEQVPKMCLT
jgi:hypothetical protein